MGGVAPGTLSVVEDVDDLLPELVGGHMVAVPGGRHQVVTRPLLLPPVQRVRRAGGLVGNTK